MTEEVKEIDQALRKLEEAGEDQNEEIKDKNEEPLYEKHLGENIYGRVDSVPILKGKAILWYGVSPISSSHCLFSSESVFL